MRDPSEFISTSQEAVAARLNLVMEAVGESQVRFASRIGVSPQTVQNWRTTQYISREGAINILRVYGVSIDWLLAGLEHKLEGEIANKIRNARLAKAKRSS